MSLLKFISTKSMAALAALLAVFSTSGAFAQAADAAQAAATAPKIDWDAVYKTAGYYVLLFLLICTFVAIIGKILKVYDLTRGIQGKQSPLNWNKIQGAFFAAALVLAIYGTYWTYTTYGPMLLPESASVHGVEIDFIFNVTLILTTIVFIITHILLFGFAYLYKGSEKRKAYYYPHNNSLERIWTIIPAIVLTILVLFGFFTWRSIFNVSEADQKKALNIEVTSEQFKWTVRYPGADGEIGNKNFKLVNPSNNLGIDFADKKTWDDQLAGEMVIPVGKPVRLHLTTKDVIHSFYMPHFRVQMNTVPGMTTYFQFTPRITTAEMKEKTNNPKFDYLFLCSKICGTGHYNMQVKVRVVSEKEYEEWIAKQPTFLNDDLRKEFHLAVADTTAAKPAIAKPAVAKPAVAKEKLALNK